MPSARSLPSLALALPALASVARAQEPSEAAAQTQSAAQPAAVQPAAPAGPVGFGGFGKSKEPITIISDNLEYDYKRNVVVYRGSVQATQGTVKVTSDTLTITLQNDKQDGQKPDGKPPPPGAPAPGGPPSTDTGRVEEIVALGNVRIDQGTRWAVGGRAVFEQSQRTLVLTENPVLHDGPSEVAGDRVVVFVDEDRSVVEGGQKRVKAVFYPSGKNAGPQGPAKPGGGARGRAGKKG